MKRLLIRLFYIFMVLPNLTLADDIQKQLDYIDTLYQVEQAPLVSSLTTAENVAHLKEAKTYPLTDAELSATKTDEKNELTSKTNDKAKKQKSKKSNITKSSKKKHYSYVVRGKRYHVVPATDKFKQIGWASWYGPGFHGKKTANGERFNQHALTAAHKTLPLGTYVYVKSVHNGKKIKVRINDRGPFAKGRVIDLSKAAAKKLGLLHRGHGKVVISVAKR